MTIKKEDLEMVQELVKKLESAAAWSNKLELDSGEVIALVQYMHEMEEIVFQYQELCK